MVFNSLGTDTHTHTHTHTHTRIRTYQRLYENNLKKPGTHQPLAGAPGLKSQHTMVIGQYMHLIQKTTFTFTLSASPHGHTYTYVHSIQSINSLF